MSYFSVFTQILKRMNSFEGNVQSYYKNAFNVHLKSIDCILKSLVPIYENTQEKDTELEPVPYDCLKKANEVFRDPIQIGLNDYDIHIRECVSPLIVQLKEKRDKAISNSIKAQIASISLDESYEAQLQQILNYCQAMFDKKYSPRSYLYMQLIQCMKNIDVNEEQRELFRKILIKPFKPKRFEGGDYSPPIQPLTLQYRLDKGQQGSKSARELPKLKPEERGRAQSEPIYSQYLKLEQ